MRSGLSQTIELFQYEAPDQSTTLRHNSDIGASHIAFWVTDLNQAVADLKAQPGVTVLGEPTLVSGQPNGGLRFVCFRTPWGQSMELVGHDRTDYGPKAQARICDVRG